MEVPTQTAGAGFRYSSTSSWGTSLIRNSLCAVTALLCAACSEKQPLSESASPPGEPRLASMIALSCPAGWAETVRGSAVLRCMRQRPGSSTTEFVLFANLKAGARTEMVFNAASPATRSTPSPEFLKRTITSWWQVSGQSRLGAFCAVNGAFFMNRGSTTTRLSFPLKSGGILRSTGSDLTDPGARVLSIRSDRGSIVRFDLATTNFDRVNAALTESDMIVSNPVANTASGLREGRTYVGLRDIDNDKTFETIFFYLTPSATESEAWAAMQSIGYSSMMQLDGGGSTQLNCAGTTLFNGDNRTIPQAFLIADARVPIHRSYRNRVPDHLYGHDPSEGTAYGYVLEQRDYFWLNASSGADAVPIYRCLWGATQHLVTRDANCERAGKREAVLGYGFAARQAGSVPLHRLHNPRSGDHVYTTSEAERQNVRAAGWTYEGITAYVWPTR